MLPALVHYHLHPGGVTTVIRSASEALEAAGVRHVILTGGEDAHARHRHVSGLGYMAEAGDHDASQLLADLRRTATEALGAPPDVWHFHNHSLGKNALIARVVARLAAEGERIVLQIHDLAEQGRPDNYQVIADEPELYPFSPGVRYAFLNRRDLGIFLRAGLPVENATLLPNPVRQAATGQPAANNGNTLLFAPVRGIRRKNLGELVLLATLAPTGTRVAVSRAPANPAALPIHDAWRAFADRHRLPIDFDVVDRIPPTAGADSGFASWIAHASHFVTTSVSEGFGLPFLESIAQAKPLVGRDLPHLTDEHAENGISHAGLYQQILIPAEWVDVTRLERESGFCLERDFQLYRRELPPGHHAATLDGMARDGWLDFANLPESLQMGVIEKLVNATQPPPPHHGPVVALRVRPSQSGETPEAPHHDTRARISPPDHQLIPLTEWLAETLAIRTPCAPPDALVPWSLENYQTRLTTLYQDLTHQPSSPLRHLPAEKILTAHLSPSSFHFLLSSQERTPALAVLRAVIFDIYGTLLIAPAGGVKSDPAIDPLLRDILRQHGHEPPASPSTALHAAVLRHHAASGVDHPEIDLRVLWREILHLPDDHDTTPLILATEAAWHPALPMPGAESFIRRLAARGIPLGLLSNAQANTLSDLGPVADLFTPGLTILSYQHGIAKPSPAIFQLLTDRLANHGILPQETLYIGNDPLHDIVPAARAGFMTALFTGHPDSLRSGESTPDITFRDWETLESWCFHDVGTA